MRKLLLQRRFNCDLAIKTLRSALGDSPLSHWQHLGGTDPGVLHAGDAAVRVFTDRGWRWGGDWRAPLDYQHFER